MTKKNIPEVIELPLCDCGEFNAVNGDESKCDGCWEPFYDEGDVRNGCKLIKYKLSN